MELFKYRRLALGCFGFLMSLIISYYLNKTVRIVALSLLGATILILLLLCFIKRANAAIKAVIALFPICLLSALAIFVSLFAFKSEALEKYCDGNEHSFTAKVNEVYYADDEMSICNVKISSIDNKKLNTSAKVISYTNVLKRGDIIKGTGCIDKIKNDPLGFDERGFSLSQGVEIYIEAPKLQRVGHDKTHILDLMEKINSYLDSRLKTVGDKNTHALMSALLLGNKQHLPKEISRDFTRLGLSHALALSGMHITIIVSIMGFLLIPLPIKPMYKELLLILASALFIGITGFSPSAIRAGAMVCLTYFLSFFGARLNIITALFVSVTVICAVSPFSIFSVSLFLSFFALLGCVVISKYAHRVRLYRKIRSKILRFIVFSCASSLFAIIFTLPITFFVFGSVSALSIPANLVLTPIFTVLIYLSPVYIIFSYIPFLNTALGFVCCKVSTFLIFLGEKCASLNEIVISFINIIQIIGVILTVLFAFMFLLLNRRQAKICLMGIALGIITLIVGTVCLNVDRQSNVYVGVANVNSSDYVFLEEAGQITIVDISSPMSSISHASSLSTTLGYYELDRYIITSYKSSTPKNIEGLLSTLILKNVYLPIPTSDYELALSRNVESLAVTHGFTVHYYSDKIACHTATIMFSPSKNVAGSTVSTTSLRIEYGSQSFTYLGAGAYYTPSRFAEESVYESNIAVFGSSGPKYNKSYTYEAPHLKYSVFLGKSRDFATGDFYEGTVVEYKEKPLRFKLCS